VAKKLKGGAKRQRLEREALGVCGKVGSRAKS
jgi:hypothetical protein